MEITTLESSRVNEVRKVAAYARVSTLQEEQNYSFQNQKEYYERLISANEKWCYAGIYADSGFSGTNKNRPQFQKMISDAKDGKINLILVKSISRFARNGVDTQNIVHDLKVHNVEVYFEEQGLSSFNRNAEMVLNMMAMVAENESRSISQNTKWALKRLAERGIRHIGNNRVFGYDEIAGELIPNENARYVKFIFEEYVAGKSCSQISRELKEIGARPLRGGDTITEGTVRQMLKNEIYCGDRLIQKQPPKDMYTKKPNYDEDYDSYYVEDHHKAIISKELWNKTQERMEKKKQEREQGIYRRYDSHPLVGKVFCGNCGEPYFRASMFHGTRVVWECKERLKAKKGNGCKNKILREDVFFQKLGIEGKPEEFEKIKRIVVEENGDLTIERYM